MKFEAEILVLYHATTMACKYQAMVHCGSVRQSARILSMDKEFIRTGDRALVSFEFVQHPEYLRVGSLMVFREGKY
jgi:GTPase